MLDRVIEKRAESDLVDLYTYLLLEAGDGVASAIEHDLAATFDLLAFMPETGKRLDLDGLPIRRFVGLRKARSYLIYYRVEANTLLIARVIHGARDQDAALSQAD